MTTMTFGEAVALRVAVADQQHTLQRIAALSPRQSQPAKHHPWYRHLGETLIHRLADGTARLCPHIGPGRGLGPMYAVVSRGPLRIQCRLCWTSASSRLDPVDDVTCDRCSVYARGLISGALPIGPLLLIFGVCRSCATELGARGEVGS